MNLRDFFAAVNSFSGHSNSPDSYQQAVIAHQSGPLWVIAGPGSGKTDSIVLRCCKLLVVNAVHPRSIVVTTFTEKAARNLEDRLSMYMQHLVTVDQNLRSIDYAQLRVGTLHSLCNDIMQEYRFTGYRNFRLLSEMEQRLFITEHSSLVAIQPPPTQLNIWTNLPYLANQYDPVTGGCWNPTHGRAPNRWVRARGAQLLFNRIVEDLVDISLMRSTGGFWSSVADAYEEYRDKLFQFYRCDFAHVQLKFLEFLGNQQSRSFLLGDGTDLHPGLSNILVDEYQDTNPIQEEIYLQLAIQGQHNVCVVGDDDQALYRFRGGTVYCMVNFPFAYARAFAGTPVTQKLLPMNYRSHPNIVNFFDRYIGSFSTMNQPGSRAPGKVALQPASGISGNDPAVTLLVRPNVDDVAVVFADAVDGLRRNGIIQEYGQCALLLRSVRATAHNALPFMNALTARGIPFYNPRSRGLLAEDEVKSCLGAFLEIIDPNQEAQNDVYGHGIQHLANDWRAAYNICARGSPDLANYVQQAAATIKTLSPRSSVTKNIGEILYRILSFPPFNTWIEDPDRTYRLGVITQVFESFSNVPPSSGSSRMLGDLYTNSVLCGGVSFHWRRNFYYSLLGILAAEGLNEPEDPNERLPRDRVPIMTVHQAKGLEFPFVFVYGLSPSAKMRQPASTTRLEHTLLQFRRFGYSGQPQFSVDMKTEQDLVRFFYVAYSRAQNALILLATANDVRNHGIGFGGGGVSWLRQQQVAVI